MNISIKTNQLILALMVSFFSLLMACKDKEVRPNQVPKNFEVFAMVSSNGNSLNLKWTKSIDPDEDEVTYSVVFKDTLIKNLKDTNYVISNLPFATDVKGSIVAKDGKGGITVSPFSATILSEYVNIPDVNFEKALILSKIDDVLDGKILRSKVVVVRELNVSYSTTLGNKIQDLSGIESFVNLTSLYCRSHNLTKVDMSNNTKLFQLVCDSNRIATLDVSKNTKLGIFYCSSNLLNKLDVTNNPELEYFGCDLNELTSLDVSKNFKMVSFSCHSNKLTGLDVRKNSVLGLLSCYSNQLTNLDISKNLELQVLLCTKNKITDLDISANTKMTSLWTNSNQLDKIDVTKNINLVSLVCNQNSLTNLDVTKNVSLKFIECSFNKLTNLDVSKNANLTTLYCYGNTIQTICVSNFSQVTTNWYKDPIATYKVCP